MGKKVLIVAYYWPPAGGPGVQRWLKFVKYLPKYNVEPIVFVPDNANYPLTDPSLVREVLKNTRVIKQPISEPYKLAALLSKKSSKNISKGIIADKKSQSSIEKLMLYVRGNFFIPDARKNWVKPSIKTITKLLETENIDTIITTGPPHSLHLIGLHIKKQFNIKWIADFRDPWTTIGYHKELKLTKKSEQKHKHLEKEVLNKADQIIVTSHVTKSEFKNLTTKPIAVITNGYDDDYVAVKPVVNTSFSLVHIGSLLSKRNPEILWQVLKDLTTENESFAQDFVLRLVGAVSPSILLSLQSYHLNQYVDHVGYVNHDKCITYQKEAQVLLLIEIDSIDTRCIIPGKLFEYIKSTRPIIALGPPASDVEKIIKDTQTGNYFSYNNYKLLKAHILSLYNTYKISKLEVNPVNISKYHRLELTKSLSKLI